MALIRIVNLSRGEKGTDYIGRPGKGQAGILGNPCRIGHKCPECGQVHQDRGSTLPCHAKYLDRELSKRSGPVFTEMTRLAAKVRANEDLALECFCSPDRCHGENIRTALCQMVADF